MANILLKMKLLIAAWAAIFLVLCFLLLNLNSPRTNDALLPLHFMNLSHPAKDNTLPASSPSQTDERTKESWRKQSDISPLPTTTAAKPHTTKHLIRQNRKSSTLLLSATSPKGAKRLPKTTINNFKISHRGIQDLKVSVSSGSDVARNSHKPVSSSHDKKFNSTTRLKFEKNRRVPVGDRTPKAADITEIAKQHSRFNDNETTARLKISPSVTRTVTSEPVLKQYIPPWKCSGCFHWRYHLVINQEDVCKSYGDKNKNQTIDLIFLIPSTHGGKAQRDAIRRTWASVTQNNTSNFRHAFFFGASKDPKHMRQMAEESRQFRDVVVNSGFDDTYRNLTLKTMTLLRWLAETCPRARFFLKVDDDMWVNSRVLLTSLGREEEQLQTAIAGRCTMPTYIFRNLGHKWGVSFSEYPADRYPAYCSGTAYAGTVGVARQLVAVSRDVPFFRLEDVFVGLCLKQLGYTPKDVAGFHIVTPKFLSGDACEAWKDRVISLHRVPPAVLQKYWNLAARCGEVEELLPRVVEAEHL